MKISNKFLFILLLFFLFLFIFINNVFGFTFSSNIPNTTDTREYNVPDLSTIPSEYQTLLQTNGYIIRAWNGGDITLYILPNNSFWYYDGSTRMYPYDPNGDSTWIENYSAYKFTISGDNWIYRGRDRFGGTSGVYFGADVYTDTTKSTLFFQNPVQEDRLVIPALETAEQIPEAMGKTMKIVIPVGLAVLSIGLVIYIIKRVLYSMQ